MPENPRSDYYPLQGLWGKEGMLKRLRLETAELPNSSLRNWAEGKGEDWRGNGSIAKYSKIHISF